MKNILSENDTDQKENAFADNQQQNSKTGQKQKMSRSKLIKGKVKVYSNNGMPKYANANNNFDERTELNIVSKRMLIFLKLSLLFLTLAALYTLFKKIL